MDLILFSCGGFLNILMRVFARLTLQGIAEIKAVGLDTVSDRLVFEITK